MRRIPPYADDVIAQRDREVNELALVVHALAADVLVAVVLRPRLLRFLELSADAVAADRSEASRPLVLTPDGTMHHLDSIASNDTKPVALQPGSVVSALKSLVSG